MNKSEIARVLEEVGTLLELAGENPFKARAYYNLARTVTASSADLDRMAKDGRLEEIPGVGKGLAEKLSELLLTGKMTYHEELLAATPAGLLELLRVPSLGPKKVKVIYEELQVKTLGELEYACKENRLASLPGFGARSQEKVLKGLAQIARHAGRFLYPEAREVARALAERLAAHAAVKRIEVAGSVRRHKETVGDVDIVCATASPEEVMEAFVSLPGTESVVVRGPTKTSVVTSAGLQVDLRAVTDAEFPFALQYFTGSKEHNTSLRALARRHDLKLNEYGLFGEGDRPVACATEADVYARLGLAYIPPELREDAGEIQAAAAGPLPELVSQGDIRGVFHCHSVDSDGSATIEQMALAARALGYEYIGLSDHSQTAAYARGLTVARVKEQWARIDELNARLAARGIRILKGIESDILPDGRLDYEPEILAQFDFVIGSVHASFQLPREEQTARLLRAMESPYLTMVGHLTGRLLLGRDGFDVDIDAIIEGAARHHVVLEVNANPHRLDVDWRHLRRAQERGVSVSINPDAHSTQGIADTGIGVGIARKGWIRPATVVNALPLDRVTAFLADQRARKGVAR
jgi:DNA polymerase (family 10)